MTLPFVDSVAGRTLLVMIVGLLLSHALSVAFYVTDRRSTISLVGGEHISERMVTLARLIESAPPAERQELARLASQSVMKVSLGPAPLVKNGLPKDWEEKILTGVFADHLSRYGVRDFRLSYRDATAGDTAARTAPSGGSRKLMQVSLRLAGGDWLNCSALIDAVSPTSIWSPRFLLSLAVMTIAVVIVSAIVVYHINRPLRTFAGAARRLGADINAPPLSVDGPRELREAVTAFNEMQERLKRFIADRRQMLAAVSHDLRTPITLLRLRAEFVESDEERDKMLATLTDMEAMVNSILAFVRDDSVEEEVQPADLVAMLNSICDDISDLGMNASYSGPDRLIYSCRPTALKRALTNVIDNAVKFGGSAEVSLRETGKHLAIITLDEGPGIPDSEIDAVFNPFHRVETSRSRQTGGVGLGLSVARSIIEAHGGSIELANCTAGGLRVTIVLPLERSGGREPVAQTGVEGGLA